MNKAKITTFLTSTALLSAVFVTPAFADTDVRIAGNGSHSDNSVSVEQNNSTTVRQTNDTNISNDVSVNNNTGHNRVSGNTGGDVNVQTGDATSNVDISNQAGMNVASVNGCCDNAGTNVKIEGNGSRSDNSVNVSKDSSLRVTQDNDTDITNDVDVHNNTGFNSVDDNTWGDVTLRTGDANSKVNIQNEAGKNVLDVNGCCSGGDTNVAIVGNGSGSDNNVWVNSNNHRSFSQDNDTDFDNNVDVHNNTGYNNASSDYAWNWYDKFDHGKKSYDKDHKDYDRNHKKDYDHNDRFMKYHKAKDHDKKYDNKDGHRYDKNKYVPIGKYLDYDHDRKSYDHDKDHKSYDNDHKRKYDFDKKSYQHDKDHFYPFVKYMKYDDSHKSYDKKHDDHYDHDKNSHPVYKIKFVDSDRCDYKHGKDFTWRDWMWQKNNCDHGKSYDAHRMVYLNHDKYDHDKNDHKKYDKDYKKVSYDHDRDHDKKDYGGKKYSFAKYPKFAYDRNDYCDAGHNSKYPSKNYTMRYLPFLGHGHGNTGGSVNLRTGDASSNVNLHNLGSSNYLNV